MAYSYKRTKAAAGHVKGFGVVHQITTRDIEKATEATLRIKIKPDSTHIFPMQEFGNVLSCSFNLYAEDGTEIVGSVQYSVKSDRKTVAATAVIRWDD